MDKKRGSFTNKMGFVLAAAGSAVGLGNLWRFPYLAAKYGGGIFLLVYLILAVTFGFTLMIAEVAIGRKTGLSAIGAFRKLNRKYSFIGYLTEYRMEQASRLLMETNEKSYVIAKSVGYTDPNYFSYVFKRRFGVSPSKYRTEHIGSER